MKIPFYLQFIKNINEFFHKILTIIYYFTDTSSKIQVILYLIKKFFLDEHFLIQKCK